MKKLPYNLLALEVEKLYQKAEEAIQIDSLDKISQKDLTAIEQHSEFIRQFIESCGWEVEEYTRMMVLEADRFCN